ncbi:lipoprotein-releasing system permease protein [Bizionia echini]|uniref:Lipoprotein-releasing system permease protein n=1 Tax=Bizionia echini TaxID=649333 RepID=A0A1I5D7L3_9FLAO|nr:FtsX-like permease family protein [Bizionia echini]SFN95235.1 lipoprotein-releasing system permease protein [Bizionia echini]
MNFEYFIAKRIIDSKAYKSSVSAPIIKIGIAAIAIGIIVMMISIATGIGLQQKIRDKVVAFNGHLMISKFGDNNSQESDGALSLDQDFYPEFKSVKGVSHIQGVATKFGIIRTETDFEAVIVKGVGTDYKWDYFQEYLVKGKLPEYTDAYSEDVLLSEYIANRLHVTVGDTIQTYFVNNDYNKQPRIIPYKIVGIYNSGFQEFDKTYVISHIKHLQRINKWEKDQVGHFELFVDDYSQLDPVREQVYQNTPPEFNTVTVEKKFESIFEWITIFVKNIYGIIGIMILVAGFNMVTALLVLILERTQMIGILKALGSNNWTIRKIFLYNASYLIILGLFWGNLIGLGILLTQKYFKIFPLDPNVYYVSEAPVYLSITYIAALNIGTFILCLLMLLIPSYIITKISPVKAIRFE